MAESQRSNPAERAARRLVGIGGRAAVVPLRPFRGVAGMAVDAGFEFERRAVDRVLDSEELERVLSVALDSPRVQAAVKRMVATDGAKAIIAAIFDSGLLDEIVDRILASPALWRMIDEIAASPAVTAAITQQSLGFADQVGDAVRARSRGADDWLDRAAHRLTRRRTETIPPTTRPSGEKPEPDTP